MNIETKGREDLRNRFVTDAIPTEADFKDLIGAALNQRDDRVVKLPGEPLSVEAASTDGRPALRLYESFNDDPSWVIGLREGDPKTGRQALSLSDGAGRRWLSLDLKGGYLSLHAARTCLIGSDPNYHWILAGGMDEPGSNALGFRVPSKEVVIGPKWSLVARELPPVGTVLPWWRPDASVPVPDGFEVCDGHVVKAGSHAFLRQDGTVLPGDVTLPDLRNRFLLGASATSAIGTAGKSGDAPADAPGIGGVSGSQIPRSMDHHHDVVLGHTHPATNTAAALRSQAVVVSLSSENAHAHSVGALGVNWTDGHTGNTRIPTLTDPKANWLPHIAAHDTSTVPAHTHTATAHDHDISHSHVIPQLPYSGTVKSAAVDAADPRTVDIVPRYIGLLMIMRVR